MCLSQVPAKAWRPPAPLLRSAPADGATAPRGRWVKGRLRFRPRRKEQRLRGGGGGERGLEWRTLSPRPAAPLSCPRPRPAPTWLNQARLCLVNPEHLDPGAPLPRSRLGRGDPAARACGCGLRGWGSPRATYRAPAPRLGQRPVSPVGNPGPRPCGGGRMQAHTCQLQSPERSRPPQLPSCIYRKQNLSRAVSCNKSVRKYQQHFPACR